MRFNTDHLATSFSAITSDLRSDPRLSLNEFATFNARFASLHRDIVEALKERTRVDCGPEERARQAIIQGEAGYLPVRRLAAC